MISAAHTTTFRVADGYLEKYRKQASFNWEKMQLLLETPHKLNLKKQIWSYFEAEPMFRSESNSLSTVDQKTLTQQMVKYLLHSGFFDNILKMTFKEKTLYLMAVNEAAEMVNPNISIKFALGISMFSHALLSLGTERHIKFNDDVWSGKFFSCIAITELEHGSDTKRLKTTATYDKETQEFIINSPGYGAAKCWIGNLGQQCTHALVFAQLMLEDFCHGLHAFIVPIRDPSTLIPYPNIFVGDVGEKAGLNGIDNGFIMFHNYRIPRENLLNRIGNVTEDGEYETPYANPQRILAAALETLSVGRIGIIQESCNTILKSVVIAVRYAAQRVQFSDGNGIELPIIEYQTHQWRLFPLVAATYVMKFFGRYIVEFYIDCVVRSRNCEMDVKQTAQQVSGLHALVCCTKALVTWTTQNAIQECREACGGHGYHKASGLADLRNNHDIRVTFEGDNNVLLQQTSNWLLRLFSDEDTDFSVFPNTYVSFLVNYERILSNKFEEKSISSINSEQFILRTYQWLICWLAKTTHDKMENIKNVEMDRFKAKNLCQVYKARSLSLVFAEYIIINHFHENCKTSDGNLKSVLNKLWSLYSLSALHKRLSFLYQAGYASGPLLAEYISDEIIRLCQELKPEMLALVDALAPPDFVLNSVLGYSDGKVYERLMKAFTGNYNCSLFTNDLNAKTKSKL